jgi:hypothetical protein
VASWARSRAARAGRCRGAWGQDRAAAAAPGRAVRRSDTYAHGRPCGRRAGGRASSAGGHPRTASVHGRRKASVRMRARICMRAVPGPPAPTFAGVPDVT